MTNKMIVDRLYEIIKIIYSCHEREVIETKILELIKDILEK